MPVKFEESREDWCRFLASPTSRMAPRTTPTSIADRHAFQPQHRTKPHPSLESPLREVGGTRPSRPYCGANLSRRSRRPRLSSISMCVYLCLHSVRETPIFARSFASRFCPASLHMCSFAERYGECNMLSYRDQCRNRRKRGSGDSLIAVSVADRALVGMTPPASPIIASRAPFAASVIGFNRRTSSRSTDLICSPRFPFQPAEPPCAERGLSPSPVPVRP